MYLKNLKMNENGMKSNTSRGEGRCACRAKFAAQRMIENAFGSLQLMPAMLVQSALT
jgi:hypothetical protein